MAKNNKIEINYKFINSEEDLELAISDLNTKDCIGIDVESHPLRSQFLDLSLLQMGDEHVQYLIDPIVEVSKLKDIFENVHIMKIFFAGDHDVLIIKKNLHCQVFSYYDLQLVHKWIFDQHNTIGLGPLIENYFDVKIPKEGQRATWQDRPLPDKLLTYAARDVAYLPILRTILNPLLIEKGLNKYIGLYFAGINHVELINPLVKKKGNFLNIKGFHELSDYEKLVARRILDRLIDVNFKGKNHFILELTKRKPTSKDEVREIMKPTRIKDVVADDIVHIIQNARYDVTIPNIFEREVGIFEKLGRSNLSILGEDQEPNIDISLNQFIKNYNRINNWVKEKSEQLNVPAEYILPRYLMKELSKYDRSIVETTEVYKIVIDNIKEELKIGFISVMQEDNIMR